MKTLFFGTPSVAVPFLSWLGGHETVAGVVTQPDKPAGRGYGIKPSPVKEMALKMGLPVFQPAGPWTKESVDSLKSLQADLGIVVAYGRLLPEPVLNATRLGLINLHFSLLPKYRGAAPMQWALIKGEKETGVSAFWLDPGMDTGPIFHQRKTLIDPADTAVTLREKLIPLGVQVLEDVLAALTKGTIIKNPQMGDATTAPLLKKEDGKINWKESSQKIINRIRGVVEWPGAAAVYKSAEGNGKRLKVFDAAPVAVLTPKEPGVILAADPLNGIVVQTGDGAIGLGIVQPEGKDRMRAWDFWQGAHLEVGDKFLNTL